MRITNDARRMHLVWGEGIWGEQNVQQTHQHTSVSIALDDSMLALAPNRRSRASSQKWENGFPAHARAIACMHNMHLNVLSEARSCVKKYTWLNMVACLYMRIIWNSILFRVHMHAYTVFTNWCAPLSINSFSISSGCGRTHRARR